MTTTSATRTFRTPAIRPRPSDRSLPSALQTLLLLLLLLRTSADGTDTRRARQPRSYIRESREPPRRRQPELRCAADSRAPELAMPVGSGTARCAEFRDCVVAPEAAKVANS